MAFLTVFGNSDDFEKPIQIKVWDGAECQLFSEIEEQFTFSPNGLVGTPLEPQAFHTVNIVESTIPITAGWNWISFNLDLGDAIIDTVLQTLSNPTGGLIKDKNSFSQYYDQQGMWAGSLTNLTYNTRYMYQSQATDAIHLAGMLLDPTQSPIEIQAGWNWIGYVPQFGMSVTQALSSLTPLNGDILKSQTTFAQYVAGIGWIGNLNFMEAPNGYLLKVSNPGTLIYPGPVSGFNNEQPAAQARSKKPQIWQVNANAFQHSMNIVGVLAADAAIELEEGDEIGVFVGEELRGTGIAQYRHRKMCFHRPNFL